MMAKYQVILGNDHPDTLMSMHNLAEMYRQQGKMMEAAKMHEEVLAKYQVILGNDHPATLTSMQNLAETYRQQGKMTEAAKMHEEMLEITERNSDNNLPSGWERLYTGTGRPYYID